MSQRQGRPPASRPGGGTPGTGTGDNTGGAQRGQRRRGGGGPDRPAGAGDSPRGANDKRSGGNRGGENREEREELDERVVDITRVAKVIQGGRRFSFRTVVVVGDGKGRIGIGIGKARAVPDSIRKGTDRARRQMITVSLAGTTIAHEVTGSYGGAKVLLRPASPGTGVIAGGGVRAVLEAVGVRDILTKSQGSNNLLNVAMATVTALAEIRSPEVLAQMRGKPVSQMRPFWERRAAAQSVTVLQPTQPTEATNNDKR